MGSSSKYCRNRTECDGAFILVVIVLDSRPTPMLISVEKIHFTTDDVGGTVRVSKPDGDDSSNP